LQQDQWRNDDDQRAPEQGAWQNIFQQQCGVQFHVIAEPERVFG
jgi:hypothetical protein